MPGFLVVPVHFGGLLAIFYSPIKVISGELGAINLLLDVNVLKLPFGQLEEAVTELAWLFDFFVDNHLIKHGYRVVLLSHVVIVLED
jgi:hypothetical protein